MKYHLNNLYLSIMLISSVWVVVNAQPASPQPGENIWHSVAGIGTELDHCCFTISSKIDDIMTGGSCDLSGTFTVLNACCICNPTPILGVTTISISGHYCLAQDIVAATTLITTSTSDVFLDLNGHSLNALNGGSAIVSVGSNVNLNVYNGSIMNGFNGILLNAGASLIKIRDVSVRNCSLLGIFADTVEQLVIEDCTLYQNAANLQVLGSNEVQLLNTSCILSSTAQGAILTDSNNILIKGCTFDENKSHGMEVTLVTGMQIEESLFNNNALTTPDYGLKIERCRSIKAINCSFSRTNLAKVVSNQLFGLSISTQLGSCSNLTFEFCTFDGNLSGGAAVAPVSFVTPGSANCLNFLHCQANGNGETGFSVGLIAIDLFMDCCFACNNAVGVSISSADPSNICITNSVAKNNALIGFNSATGRSFFKENQAIGNGNCGFNFAAINVAYVANVASNNGSNPANSVTPVSNTDTNYCLAGSPSTFTAPGPGPVPYQQVTPAFTPLSYWNNITLP